MGQKIPTQSKRRSHLQRALSGFTAIAMILPTSVGARELSDQQQIVASLQENVPTCIPSGYQSPANPNLPPISNCTTCKQSLEEAIKGVTDKYPGLVAKSKAADAKASTNAATTAAATTGKQDTSQGSTQNVKSGAVTGLNIKAGAATELSAAGKACAKKIEGSCQVPLAQDDITKVDKATQACERIAKESAATAVEKTGSGMDMGQLAQLAGAAMQAMQAMKPNAGAESAAPSSLSQSTPTTPTIANAESSKLGGAGERIGSTVGFGGATNPSGASIAGGPSSGTFASGLASPFGAQSFEPELAESLGGSDPGSFGNASSPSVASGAGSPGGGGASGDGSGSSRLGSAEEEAARAAALAAAESAYEIGGGGGGRPAFLGLKSKSGDLELGEEGAAGDGVLGELGIDEEGDREVASDVGVNDIGDENGVTLFKVIHSKYAEIKKRGNI